jgi:hypothetical protein
LLVLGRASLNWLLLDGRTGRIGLGEVSAAQPQAEVLIDPLASDLAVLMRSVHELDAVREAAEDSSAREGRRGWDVVVEVHAELMDRLHGIDPAVFDPSGLAPHWSGLAFAHALRWAARRGAWVGLPLAFEITAELMAGFGQTQPVRPEDLPPSLTHEPTRSLLTTFGLPDVGMLRGDEKRPMATLRERHPVEEDELADPAQLDRICLGESVYDSEVLVDGGTGRLEIAAFEDWLATYLHADLSAFYLAVWSVERLGRRPDPAIPGRSRGVRRGVGPDCPGGRSGGQRYRPCRSLRGVRSGRRSRCPRPGRRGRGRSAPASRRPRPGGARRSRRGTRRPR